MSHLTVQQLSSALDGALTGASLELVVRHLAVCADCRDRQSRLVRHDDVLRRLLSQEAGDAFLEALGARAEDIAVAIARGSAPPAMATTVPLLHEEDPQEPSEPPMDPSLGLSRLIAQEGGYGRIGMKPTASGLPPDADAGEARRWLDAVDHGTPHDPNPFVAEPPAPPASTGSLFELPGWIEDRAARAPMAPLPPRDTQGLRLVPSPGEVPAPTPPDFESLDEPREDVPYEHRSLMPMSFDPYASRTSAPMPVDPPAPAFAPPPAYSRAPMDASPGAPPASRPAAEAGYATRGTAIAAARRRVLEEARQRALKRHWLLAGASVCVLLLIVLALQLVPVTRDKTVPVTQSSASAPRVEFPRGNTDAGAAPPAVPSAPELRSASQRNPVDQTVPPRPRVIVDTATVAPEDAAEDSAGTGAPR